MKFPRVGFRTQLFIISTSVLLVVLLVSGLYLEQAVRRWIETRLETHLVQQARAARLLMEEAQRGFDEQADRFASSTATHVSVYDVQGCLWGDSTLTPGELSARRARKDCVMPREGLLALERDLGVQRRHDEGVSQKWDSLYVALPFEREGQRYVLRLSRSMSGGEPALRRLRSMLFLGGFFGLFIALVMGNIASLIVSRTLRDLTDHARSHAAGEGAVQLEEAIAPFNDFGGLATSISKLATDLQITVTELATERDRFEAVLESMNEAVLALDENHRVTLVNRACLELLGLEREPLEERVGDVLPVRVVLEMLEEASPGEEVISREFDLGSGNGSRQVLANVSPQRAFGGYVIVMHDVTELRRLETMRRDFVANVSHELRTPVSVIMANTETLLALEEEQDAQSRRFLDGMYRNAERLSRLISDLLDISRLEAGKYTMILEPVPMATAIVRVLEAVEGTARSKQQVLEVDIEEELIAFGDPKALDQVLVNLVENAIKYTPQVGRIEVRAFSVAEEPGSLRIEVSDDGPGIPASHRSRIFERFYRVDPGRSRDQGGTGLGLSIVKHLVAVMGGRVGVMPGDGQGTTFWVILQRYEEGAARRSEVTEVSLT